MAAEPKRTYQDSAAVGRAVGAGRTLAASMPRLILEARRVAATVNPRPARPPPRRTRREFLAIPPLHVRRAGVAGRLAALGARRSSLCARAGMGGRAYGVDLARPLAVDEFRLAAGSRLETFPHAGHRAGARRGSGRGRRARRHSRPDAADRQPQCRRPDGAGDRARSRRALKPAAELRALPARRSRAALRSVERDRRRAAHHHPALRQRRPRPCGADRRSGRGDFSVLGPRRIRRAGRRRPHHRRPRRDLARRLHRARCAPPRRNPRRDRPSRLELYHPSHRPAGERASAGAARPHRCRCGR